MENLGRGSKTQILSHYTMVGEGGPEGDTAPHNYRGLIFGQNNLIRS